MIEVFGGAREAVVARELTKTFETIKLDTLASLLDWMKDDPNQQKGEFVVIVRGAPPRIDEEELDKKTLDMLALLATELPPKKAAALTSTITGANKKRLYQHLLDS
ncbi:Ribosomal RNA small subunit methyltransferase I [Nitrincola nitratireducens]|uniref:Ribosomal RNA small subunit methyltransferase I n=2 Tax=Nitrincola TaxID=267849 RepID=W9V432_9GAMM|nr:Ribosomal RNA small subunit methyltransferase I [Nitrincola nitratireducens]